jgi:hypothetical protein
MEVIRYGEYMLIGSLITGFLLVIYYIGIGSAVSNKIIYLKSYTINISIYLYLGLCLTTIFESIYYRKFGGEDYELIQLILISISLYGLYKMEIKKLIEYFVKYYIYIALALLISIILMNNSVNILTSGIFFRPFQELIFYKGANELVLHDFYNQFSGADTYLPVITIIISKLISTGLFNVLEAGLLVRIFPILLFLMVMLSIMELLGINKNKKFILILLCAAQFDQFFLVNNNIAFYGAIILLSLFNYFYRNKIISTNEILKIIGIFTLIVILYKSMFFLDLSVLATSLFTLIIIYYVSSTPIVLLSVITVIILQLHRASIAFIFAVFGIIILYIFLNKNLNKNAL